MFTWLHGSRVVPILKRRSWARDQGHRYEGGAGWSVGVILRSQSCVGAFRLYREAVSPRADFPAVSSALCSRRPASPVSIVAHFNQILTFKMRLQANLVRCCC